MTHAVHLMPNGRASDLRKEPLIPSTSKVFACPKTALLRLAGLDSVTSTPRTDEL